LNNILFIFPLAYTECLVAKPNVDARGVEIKAELKAELEPLAVQYYDLREQMQGLLRIPMDMLSACDKLLSKEENNAYKRAMTGRPDKLAVATRSPGGVQKCNAGVFRD